MLHRWFHCFIALPFSLLATHAIANTSTGNFIQQRALDPIKLQTGLPEAASRLSTRSELQLSVLHNNVFMGGRATTERLIFDGESNQVNLRYRRALNACWQVNLSGALLSHSSGWFDNPVDDWHQAFGLPDAQRGEWPANQLDYTYEKGNRQQSLTSDTSGWGDAQLQVQRYVGCSSASPIIRAGAKLPIGASDRFLGSGGLDLFLDVQSAWRKTQPASRWQWAASVGVLKSGKNDLVAEQESLVGFGVAGLNLTLNAQWQFLGQLDWHTPMFTSELRELGDTAVQLTLGLRYQSLRAGAWEVSFSEDAVIDTAPDIAVRLAWVSRFGAATQVKAHY